MTRVNRIVVVVSITLLFVGSLFVPFSTELVPQWKLRVVDANGSSLANIQIEESWEHYTFSDAGFPEARGWELKRSDENGEVVFKRKLLTAIAASRVFNSVRARILMLAHGSAGLEISARVFDHERNYFSGSPDRIYRYYDLFPEEPLPHVIIATPGS